MAKGRTPRKSVSVTTETYSKLRMQAFKAKVPMANLIHMLLLEKFYKKA